MSQPALTIGPEESVNQAMRSFTAHRLHHIPVVEQRPNALIDWTRKCGAPLHLAWVS